MAQGNQLQKRNLASEAFRRNYESLHGALAQPDVASGLAIKLYNGAIITSATREAIQFPASITPRQQADVLLQAVDSSVKIDHTRLRKFTRVLKKEPVLEPIAKRLRQCYSELVSEARLTESSSSGSDTDPTEQQNRSQDTVTIHREGAVSLPSQLCTRPERQLQSSRDEMPVEIKCFTTAQEVRESKKKLQEEYTSVVTKVQKVLLEKPPDLLEFSNHVTLLPPEIKVEYQHYLKNYTTEISKATSVKQILFIINRDSDYLNYGLYEHIEGKYGDSTTEHEMQNYVQRVDSFRRATSLRLFMQAHTKRKVEVPEKLGLETVFSKHGCLTLESTLHNVEEYRKEFVYEYSLFEFTMFLYQIKPGCVTTVWLVPSLVASILRDEIQGGRVGVLQRHQILEFRIGDTTIYSSSSGPPESDNSLSTDYSSGTKDTTTTEFVVRAEVTGLSTDHGSDAEEDKGSTNALESMAAAKATSSSTEHSSDAKAEWKKKMMQWEKSREVVKETEPVVASQSEEEVPAWIKKLLGLFIQFYDQPQLFFEATRENDLHRGHIFLARWLQSKEFSTDKERGKKHDTDLTLVPVMLMYGLLTSTESQQLLCEKKTPLPAELCFYLSKWQLRNFEFEGPLAGRRYSELMSTFQTCRHNGDWCKLEVVVQNILSCGIPELGAVSLLEEAISHIFRQERGKALDCVDRVRQLIKESSEIQQSGGNTLILEARCELVVSHLYRYAEDYREAFHHVTNAQAHLSLANSAEDKSSTLYLSACIRLESYTKGLAVDEEQVKQDFKLAIDFARSCNIGMEFKEPLLHIRLAQLCLGSTQFQAGYVTEKDRLREAKNSLSEVNVDRLSQRSKSLFYLLKSDLYMNEGKMDEAIASATESLELSKIYGFAVGQQSAEARLQSLKSGLTAPTPIVYTSIDKSWTAV